MTDFNQHQEDNVYDSNTSGNPEFFELLDKQITRRSLIKKNSKRCSGTYFAALQHLHVVMMMKQHQLQKKNLNQHLL